jgi:hypothetical protein
MINNIAELTSACKLGPRHRYRRAWVGLRLDTCLAASARSSLTFLPRCKLVQHARHLQDIEVSFLVMDSCRRISLRIRNDIMHDTCTSSSTESRARPEDVSSHDELGSISTLHAFFAVAWTVPCSCAI